MQRLKPRPSPDPESVAFCFLAFFLHSCIFFTLTHSQKQENSDTYPDPDLESVAFFCPCIFFLIFFHLHSCCAAGLPDLEDDDDVLGEDEETLAVGAACSRTISACSLKISIFAVFTGMLLLPEGCGYVVVERDADGRHAQLQRILLL
jgi:hypothetical protein